MSKTPRDSSILTTHIKNAEVYCDQHRYEDAITALTQGLEEASLVSPEVRADLYARRALCYYYLQQYDLAIMDYTNALDELTNETSPKEKEQRARLFNQRGRCHYLLNDYEKAWVDSGEILKIFPKKADTAEPTEPSPQILEHYRKMLEKYRESRGLIAQHKK